MVAWIGFLIATTGLVLGVAGALWMAHSYHPFSLAGFTARAFRIAGTLLTRGMGGLAASNELTSQLGEVNPENRGKSLLGLYLVFLGFCLQFIGSILSFIASRAG